MATPQDIRNQALAARGRALQQVSPQQAVATPLQQAAYNSGLPMLHGSNIGAANDPTGYMAAAAKLNDSLQGLYGGFSKYAGGSSDDPYWNTMDPYHLALGSNTIMVDPWTGTTKLTGAGMTSEHLMDIGASDRMAKLRGSGVPAAPTALSQALGNLQAADYEQLGRQADQMLSGGYREGTTREQLIRELQQQRDRNEYNDGFSVPRQQPVTAAQLDAQQNELNKLWGDFSGKYLPSTLRSQIQSHVDAGMDFTPTGLVGSNDYAVNRVTASLASMGINDLSQIGVTPDGKYYDRKSGAEIHPNIMTFKGGRGDGNLNVQLRNNNGQVYLGSDYNAPETNFIDDIMPQLVLAFIGGMAGPAIGGALGGALGGGTVGSTVGNTLGYGIAGGTTSAAQGGDFGQGFLGGAISGGLSSGIGTGAGQYNLGADMLGAGSPSWQQAIINRGAAGALSGAAKAGATGGNISAGALGGAVGGATTAGLNSALPEMTAGGIDIRNMVSGALGGQLGRAVAGAVAGTPSAPGGLQKAVARPASGGTSGGLSLPDLAALPAHARQRVTGAFNRMTGNG